MNDLVLSDLKTEISVGKITTNAAELLSLVKRGVEKYHDDSYIPNEMTAKADRAELNRVEKSIATQAQQIKAEYNAPLDDFNEIVSEIRKTIKEAVQVVDDTVKTYEELQKSKKRQEIEDNFKARKFELVSLDRIFDVKWLNKTKTMKEVCEELDAKISAIYRDIEILEKIPDHGMAAKAFYLENLDMGASLRQVEALKENAEKLAKEQAFRESRKVDEQVSANARAERQERREERKEEIVKGMLDQAIGVPVGTTAEQEREEIIEYTVTFKGTREQLKNLKEYMSANGIAYFKGLRLESEDDARHMMKVKNVAGRIYYLIYVPAA